MPGLWLLPSPARIPVALLPLPLWRSPVRKQGCGPVHVIHWVGPRAEDGVEKGGECAWGWGVSDTEDGNLCTGACSVFPR